MFGFLKKLLNCFKKNEEIIEDIVEEIIDIVEDIEDIKFD